MMNPLGRTSVDGYLGEDPDFSTVTSQSGKLLEAVISGSLMTYLVDDVQQVGGELLASGNYANPVGGMGESNTSSNAGAGVELVLPKSGVDLPFRTLLAGPGVTLTQNANEILIEVNVASFKTQSTETAVVIGTPLTITPPSGGRVVIENMQVSTTTPNSTFSIQAGGSDFISAGSKSLVGGSENIRSVNQFRIGNTGGDGGINRVTFGVDKEVIINRGSGSNIVVSYNIEVPDV